MSNWLRCIIQEKILKVLNISECAALTQLKIRQDHSRTQIHYELPLKTSTYVANDAEKNALKNLFTDGEHENLIKNTSIENKNDVDILRINIDRNAFIKKFLESNKTDVCPPKLRTKPKKIIVEFSSPNIAKPFHVGHLRSTIIGNYLANLQKYLANDVTKINYLGDWGTQLGLLQLGLETLNVTEEDLANDSIQTLYKAYVHANKIADDDPAMMNKAREIFLKIENGDITNLKQWEFFKTCTLKELNKIYDRLGVQFDEFHYESMYGSNHTEKLHQMLIDIKLIIRDSHGRETVNLGEHRKVPLIKSDGSTLYMFRDIAAALDRAEKYQFDEMYYIVDNSQQLHFKELFDVLNRMKMPWAKNLHHIKFGKILGMSTRSGNVVFLSDVLDEAKQIIKERQLQSPRTKVSGDTNDNSSDILGVSAIMIHDLKQRRMRDYRFSWDRALDVRGESGIKLQYTHCRLCSLKENCGVSLPTECHPDLLNEPVAAELLAIMSQFDEIILLSHETLEACYLAKYLFHLSHAINGVFEKLRVKGEPTDIASQRLLLLEVARNILHTGMKLLGLIPLIKM